MNSKKSLRLGPRDILKFAVVEHLGLTERLFRDGWGGLTAKETGMIGARMAPKALNESLLLTPYPNNGSQSLC